MTLRGFCIAFVELFLLILAFGTEIREFYIMALCVGGLLLYSVISLLLVSVTLDVKSKINKAAALRGEIIKYELIINGIALLPVAGYLSVKSADVTAKENKRHRHSFLVMPSFFIKRDFAFELPCTHIGRWDVGIKKLRFEDIFGLFSIPLLRSNKENFTAELSVMPKIHYFDDGEETVSSGGYGNSSVSNAEEGELLGDSRTYREGDSLKRINWKQSARTKTLYSRQYENLQKPKIVIAVDTAFCGENMLGAVDIAYETALSLSDYFVENLNPVELILLRCTENTGSNSFLMKNNNDIVKMQYDFSGMAYYSASEPLTLDKIDTYFLKSDKIYFITNNPSESLMSDIRDMNKNGKTVKCVVPKTDILEIKIKEEESEGTLAIITSVDKIPKKGGALL